MPNHRRPEKQEDAGQVERCRLYPFVAFYVRGQHGPGRHNAGNSFAPPRAANAGEGRNASRTARLEKRRRTKLSPFGPPGVCAMIRDVVIAPSPRSVGVNEPSPNDGNTTSPTTLSRRDLSPALKVTQSPSRPPVAALSQRPGQSRPGRPAADPYDRRKQQTPSGFYPTAGTVNTVNGDVSHTPPRRLRDARQLPSRRAPVRGTKPQTGRLGRLPGHPVQSRSGDQAVQVGPEGDRSHDRRHCQDGPDNSASHGHGGLASARRDCHTQAVDRRGGTRPGQVSPPRAMAWRRQPGHPTCLV